MGCESGREKQIAGIISEELDNPGIAWAAIDSAAKRIAAQDKSEKFTCYAMITMMGVFLLSGVVALALVLWKIAFGA